MAKANKKRADKYKNKHSIKSTIEDAIKLSVEPPPKAITPPEKPSKKTTKKNDK